MREYGSNINLPSLDNLFSSEQERQDAKLEKIQILPLTKLHPFRNHPFQVRDDDEMDKMVDSIKEYGVMTPAIVRPRKDGGYEIVAGHRRCHASQRAGVETMPCIVRDMDDDTAIILMVDSNCQREHILPSEKAKAYEMKLEAIKRQGQRTDLTSGQLGQKLSRPISVEQVADDAGTSPGSDNGRGHDTVCLDTVHHFVHFVIVTDLKRVIPKGMQFRQRQNLDFL